MLTTSACPVCRIKTLKTLLKRLTVDKSQEIGTGMGKTPLSLQLDAFDSCGGTKWISEIYFIKFNFTEFYKPSL